MKKKISKKDIEDWNNFVNKSEKLEDKDKKIISGDPKKIKKVYDTWKFSRDIRSSNPNWSLIETQT